MSGFLVNTYMAREPSTIASIFGKGSIAIIVSCLIILVVVVIVTIMLIEYKKKK